MKIAIININRSRVHRSFEYHLFTTKAFVEERSNGKYTIELLDLFLTDDVKTSSDLIQNGGFNTILFHVQYWNADYMNSILKELDGSGLFVGVWGHDTFSHPEEYLKKNVDFIIQDEPELSLYEVAGLRNENDEVSKAAGIIYKDSEKRNYAYGANRVLDNIDLIPSPYVNDMIEVDEDTAVYWEVARGCLFRCDFCVEFSHANNMRYHSFGYLEEELKFFAQKDVREIIIGAPVFNLSHQHFRKILETVRKYLPYALIEMQVRPDILTREEIEWLSEMNVYLNFGLQTFNRKVLENLMTSINIENALQNIRYMNNFPSLNFGLDIIGGLPKTNWQTFLDDLDQAFYVWPIHINVYRLSMYPGTRMHNRTREFEYRVEHSYPFRAVENPEFSRREMEKVEEFGAALDILYNQGRLVPVFTMIATGLEQKPSDIVEKWEKWIRKHDVIITDDTPYSELFQYISDYFNYMFDRYQKKKLWPLTSDLLLHNFYYTSSLTEMEEDMVTYPYVLEELNDDSIIGMNKSAFVDRFTYNIEDVVEAGYIDIKKYVSDEEKENLCGIIYRIDDGVFTNTISDEEHWVMEYIQNSGDISLKEIKKKFPQMDIFEFVQYWVDEGALYIKEEE